MSGMRPGETLTPECPKGGPCRRNCRAASIGQVGATMESAEELDRDIERVSGPGSKAFGIARRHRQDRLNREVRKHVERSPEDCAKK